MPSDYNDTGIATGAIANIQNGADSVPVKSWEIEIEPNLDGKSQIIATQAGKNLFDKNATPFQTDKYIISTSVIGSSDFTYSGSTNYNVYRIKIVPNTTYTISNIKANAPCWGLMNTEGLITNVHPNNGGTEGTNITLTTGSTDVYLFVSVAVKATYKCDDIVQIEKGSTATTYEQYNAKTNTVNLGQTIYGGEADVVNGTGTEEYNKITLSSLLTDLSVAQIGTTGVYRIRFSLADAKGAVNSAVFDGLCDYYTPLSANQTYNKNEGISINTSGQCYIYDSRFNTSTSLNDFKTWIDANPVNLCYELATSIDFTFTPITPTPETALGVNNFWADTGDSEVTYYKSGYGYTSVTVNQKDSSDTLIDTKTIKLHRLIYEGSVDVIRGIGTISVGESGTEYDPPESFTFPPVSFDTIEGEQFLFASEGNSALTYRKAVDS